jgi:hypothetical protein
MLFACIRCGTRIGPGVRGLGVVVVVNIRDESSNKEAKKEVGVLRVTR